MSKDSTTYSIRGKQYDRVTTVIDYFQAPELVDWRIAVGKREARRVSTAALKVGTRVHNLIHKYYETGGVSVDKKDSPEVQSAVDAFLQWTKGYFEKPVALEKRVWSDELGVAGTFDAMYPDLLLDFKTSKRIDPKHWIQLGAYRMLAKSDVSRIAVLRLDKQMGVYEYEERAWDPVYWEVFKGLLWGYRYFTQYNKKEKKDEYGKRSGQDTAELITPEDTFSG